MVFGSEKRAKSLLGGGVDGRVREGDRGDAAHVPGTKEHAVHATQAVLGREKPCRSLKIGVKQLN